MIAKRASPYGNTQRRYNSAPQAVTGYPTPSPAMTQRATVAIIGN